MDQGGRGGKIVVGVDGSRGSQAAVAWALYEAARRNAEVETVFAWTVPARAYDAPGFLPVEPKAIEAEGRALLDQSLALVSSRPRVHVHSRVGEGRPADVLAKVAEEPEVCMLVVGTRGHGDLARLVLGSVSHALSHHCPKPLVIIPRAGDPPFTFALQDRIVVGVDGSPGSDIALRWAAEEAEIRGATLEVVVAWSLSRAVFPTRFSIPGSVGLCQHKAARRLADKAMAQVGSAGVAVESRVSQGGASSLLIDEACWADLLVVGRRGLNRAKEALVGSVSHACARRSPTPVVIVPSEQMGPPKH